VDVDDQNRILLATRTLLVVDRKQERVIIADTGNGPKWSKEKAERFAIRHDPEAISRSLAAIGLRTEDVTDVVVTHLHFDHNGGLTRWFDDPGGRVTLCFPHARHWIHKTHWEHAQHPHLKDRASFLPEDFAALGEAGVLEFVDGENPLSTIPGIEWFVSHGHTPFHLHPIVTDGDQRLLFVGDLAPTVAHLRLAWVMAYDLFPLTTITEKQFIFRNAIENGWLLAFAHDPNVPGVSLSGTVDRPIVVHALEL
jgi:glyoxylase-like metal-dependent hydrolase (beta-lactamase superfamily II)